jgi:hypothetical protein
MKERGSAVFAPISLAGEMDTGKPTLIGEIHNILFVLSMSNEILAAASIATKRPALAAGIDGEGGAIGFCGHDGDTR